MKDDGPLKEIASEHKSLQNTYIAIYLHAAKYLKTFGAGFNFAHSYIVYTQGEKNMMSL